MSDPSSDVPAISLRTDAKFESVTPVIPRRAKSCAVSAGDAVPPAATVLRRSITSAMRTNSVCESTSEDVAESITEFIRLTSEAELRELSPNA